MKLEDCLWAVVERRDDGSVICPLIETGSSCEECYQIIKANKKRRKGKEQ